MKTCLIICFLLFSSIVFAQDKESTNSSGNNEQYGYIDGVRLDSINAEYVEVNLYNKAIHFDYGQQTSPLERYRVTDNTGAPLRFKNNSAGTALNFMFFNGWEYINNYEDSFHSVYFLFKKRKLF